MGKMPSIQVPANVFLELARLYRELPQEKVERDVWFIVRDLERRAYRKISDSARHAERVSPG